MRRDDLLVTHWGAQFYGRRFACSVGRAGIGIKRREGDLLSPRGVWQIEEVWTRPDRMPFDGRVIGLRDAWCDDPEDPRYNTAILTDVMGEEQLRRPDPLYDIVAVLNYNRDPVRNGEGSAIFMHCWRKPRHPTAGCIAFAKPDLVWILAHWTTRSRVVIR